MIIFEKRPPRVEAVQWDGTQEGLKTVWALAKKSREQLHLTYSTHMTSNLDAGGEPRITISGSNYHMNRDILYKDDWLVLDLREKTLQIMTQAELDREYKFVLED